MALTTAMALLGAGAISAGSSIISGNKSANAISDAADKSAAVNKYVFDTTRADWAPQREVGYGALAKLAQLYGIDTGGVQGGGDWSAYLRDNPDVAQGYDGVSKSLFQTPEDFAQWHYQNYGQREGRALPGGMPATSGGQYDDFWKSPDYGVRLAEGEKAINRFAASRGMWNAPATGKSLSRFVQGEATKGFEAYAGRLAQLAGFGSQATAATANAGSNYASNASSSIMNAGNARASSYQNTGNAVGGAIQNMADIYAYDRGGGFNMGGGR